MGFHDGGCRGRIPSLIAAIIAASLSAQPVASAEVEGHLRPEYLEIKQRLARGWNTWNTRSVLSPTLLPEGFGLNLAFKQVRSMTMTPTSGPAPTLSTAATHASTSSGNSCGRGSSRPTPETI
jgi:hypothetical protein